VVNLPLTVNNLSREKPDMLTRVISIKEHLSSICPCESCSALNRQSRFPDRGDSTPEGSTGSRVRFRVAPTANLHVVFNLTLDDLSLRPSVKWRFKDPRRAAVVGGRDGCTPGGANP
jgi:hypothetical protein